MKPIVSIILPTYNGAQNIAKTIESVIAQTYQEWELVIVSDGSSDNTAAIVEHFSQKDCRIIYIPRVENRGIQKTLNEGVALAQGMYIARIDDDDCWIEHTKLEAQVDFFEKNPGYVLIGTDALIVDEKGKTLSVNTMPKSDESIRASMLSKNCFLHSTVMTRRAVLLDAGGYSEAEEVLHAEDYDLWLRIGLKGKVANLALRSAALTARGQSLTSRNRAVQAWRVLRAARKHTGDYPHAVKGLIVSTMRALFFSFLKVVPVPRSVFYWIQRMHKAV